MSYRYISELQRIVFIIKKYFTYASYIIHYIVYTLNYFDNIFEMR